MLEQIRASADGSDDGSVANFQYGFDSNGTLMQRTDLLEGYTESFCNDALNRLTGAAVGNPGSTSCTAGRIVKSVAYDDLGNITSKSDVGTYSYPAAGSARPHAVSSVTGMVLGASNPHYAYDANGNVTCAYTASRSYRKKHGCAFASVANSEAFDFCRGMYTWVTIRLRIFETTQTVA